MAADESSVTEGGAGIPAGKPAGLRALALFLLVAAVFMALYVMIVGGNAVDVDDRLRAVQIHQLLQGKGWYDLTLSGIAMPEPYVSPWSRLVDAPYVAIAGLLSWAIPREDALHLAFLVFPPFLLLVFAALAVATMVRLAPQRLPLSLPGVLFAALVMNRALFEFMPLRIDHHGMQLLALAALAFGTMLWSSRGAMLMAGAVVLSVTVGLEGLPIIAVLWAGVALAWVFHQPGADRVFLTFSLSLTVLAPLVTLLVAGPRGLTTVETDIFSAPYVTLFTVFAFLSVVAAKAMSASRGVAGRLAALAFAGVVSIAIVLSTMPAVLTGPFAMIDSVSRSLWLNRIPQENSILLLVAIGQWPRLIPLAIEASLIVFAAATCLSKVRSGRVAPLLVLAMGIAAFCCNLVAFRFLPFPAMLLSLFLPGLLTRLLAATAGRRRQLAAATLLTATGSAGLLFATAKLLPLDRSAMTLQGPDYLTLDTCSPADKAAFASLPAGRYLSTPPVSLKMLEGAPSGAVASALHFHRGAPAMRRLFDALYFQEPAARRAALAPFDYVVLCAYPPARIAAYEGPPSSAFASLIAGRPVPGLEPVLLPLPAAQDTSLRLYRIDHDRL
ncbi:hypothetical protein [Rhizobium sp. RU20A]|uniref:hypothetical protein n=1 Tax=Rhizobium sp. RU20A TaxID=1907412 RepID=UPI00122CAFC2|nr:hypothetical protein [Rhizobium sp. RU20A]